VARNALTAVSLAIALGVSASAIAQGLSQFAGAPGRLQRKLRADGVLVLDDTYNANPDSMRAALRVLAAQPGAPLRRLVLNDVGPLITQESLKRIGEYVGSDPTWATLAEAERYVRAISAPFGPLSDADWCFLTETSVAQRTDGRWGFRYDPAIAAPFRAACGELAFQQIPKSGLRRHSLADPASERL
jgi:hypothetical protein